MATREHSSSETFAVEWNAHRKSVAVLTGASLTAGGVEVCGAVLVDE